MKKILLFILLCCCFVFAGCSDIATVGMVQNSDGTITEFYYVPYMELELVSAGLAWEESEAIKDRAKLILDEMFTNYINAYKYRVNASEDYTNEEKEVLLAGVKFDGSLNYIQSTHFEIGPNGVTTHYVIEYIQYELYFTNSTCYLEFKNANELLKEPKEVEVINNFFTTTTKVVKDPVFDNIAYESLTLGQTMAKRIQDTIVSILAGDNATPQDLEVAQTRWNAIKLATGFDASSETFSYTYVVPTKRIHSNADRVVAQNGYYYHIWEISADNSSLPEGERIQFEYWTITANRVVWYITALVVAGIIIVTTYFIAKFKEKREIEKIRKEISID